MSRFLHTLSQMNSRYLWVSPRTFVCVPILKSLRRLKITGAEAANMITFQIEGFQAPFQNISIAAR